MVGLCFLSLPTNSTSNTDTQHLRSWLGVKCPTPAEFCPDDCWSRLSEVREEGSPHLLCPNASAGISPSESYIKESTLKRSIHFRCLGLSLVSNIGKNISRTDGC